MIFSLKIMSKYASFFPRHDAFLDITSLKNQLFNVSLTLSGTPKEYKRNSITNENIHLIFGTLNSLI